jgi:hypothetical protein
VLDGPSASSRAKADHLDYGGADGLRLPPLSRNAGGAGRRTRASEPSVRALERPVRTEPASSPPRCRRRVAAVIRAATRR